MSPLSRSNASSTAVRTVETVGRVLPEPDEVADATSTAAAAAPAVTGSPASRSRRRITCGTRSWRSCRIRVSIAVASGDVADG